MKMKSLSIVGAIAAALTLSAGCDMLGGLGDTPTVTITAGADTFDDAGDASVVLALSSYAIEDVTVNLAVSGEAATAVTMEKTISFGIGAKSKVVPVKLDVSAVSGKGSITITINSANGATVGTPREATISYEIEGNTPAETPSISIAEASETFSNNVATVIVALSEATAADVTAKLSVVVKEDVTYAQIPAVALTFDSNVTIAAGATSAVVNVTLDPTSLPNGDSFLYLGLSEPSENAKLGSSVEACIYYTKELVPTLREDWIIEYGGNYDYPVSETETVLLDLIVLSGLGEQPFLFNYYSAGTLAYNNLTPDDYVAYMAKSIANAIANGATAEDLDVIIPDDDPFGILVNLLDPQEYEVIVLGCNEDGSLTGEYAYATFEVEDPEEATPEYEAWIGVWNFNGNTFYIDHAWNNKSFKVYGFDTDYSLEVPAFFEPEGGFLYFEGVFVEESSKYLFYICGLTEDYYIAWGDPEQNYRVATLTTTDTGYELNGISYVVTYDDGTTADRIPMSLGILGYSKDEESWYRFSDCVYIDLPCTEITKETMSSSSVASRKASSVKELKSLGRRVKSLHAVKGQEAKAVLAR